MFESFSDWLVKNYAKTTRSLILCHVRRFHGALDDVLQLNSLSGHTKTHTIKSLIVFSKFLGRHEDFKQSMKRYGIKVDNRNSSLDSFIRILNAQNNDVLKWLAEVMPYMRSNERLFSKFALATGLRISEVVKSFNLIIDLAHSSRLHEYYDENLSCLQHFRFKDLFIRRTKCCYLSFVSKKFIQQIASSQLVTYSAIKKNLERTRGSHIMKYNLCRDYFGTFMIRHGLIKEEVDLLQGRIPPSIFIRHYWSPSFKELKERTLKAITELTQTLN